MRGNRCAATARATDDLGARTAAAVCDDDPFAFGARARALFEDIDGETLAEDDDDDDDDARRGDARRIGRGVSVFEKMRREKAGTTMPATTATTATATATAEEEEEDAFDEPRAKAKANAKKPAKAKAGRERAREKTARDGGDDDVMVVDDDVGECARPAEDLFDEVAATGDKRAKREVKTLARPKKRVVEAPAAVVETHAVMPAPSARAKASTTGRIRASTSAAASAPPPAKKKKVSLKEFAGEEDGDEGGFDDGEGDDDHGLVPQSGAQLADIDEANYAVSGLSTVRDVKEKMRCVGVLANLMGNQRTRRLLASYGIPMKIIKAAQDAAMAPHAPNALKFGAAALLYLAASDLRAPATDAMRSVKSANAIRALLRPASSSDDALYLKTANTVRSALKALKFLPNEAKDAPTLALLVAHQTLKGEQDAVLASGSGPGAGDVENSFRTILANQGAVLATCELVAQATTTLSKFGGACFVASASASTNDSVDDESTIEEYEQSAARVIARLFRASRVLECVSFESPAACAVISTSALGGSKRDDTNADVRPLDLLAVSTTRPTPEDGLNSSRGDGRGVESATTTAAIDIPSPSPVKSRIPGGITMTPPSTPGAVRVAGTSYDDNDGLTPLSSPVPIGLMQTAATRDNAAAIQWLADNVRTPVKGGSHNARTACRALVEALPTLAAATTASVVGAKKGDVVQGIEIRYNAAIAVDHRVAVGALKSALCTLTNVTNENKEGCDAVVGEDSRGLLVIASLIPWLALSIEGFTLRDAKERKRTRTPTDDSGSSLLNAALVLLVNIVEADATTADVLRNAMVRLPGDSSRGASFVEALTMLYLQSGGADEDEDEGEKETAEEAQHLTADMIKSYSSKTNGDDLILQAYCGLLLAFLIEDDAALRAEVTSTFPEKPQGTSRLKPLADTLERFHAFHESLNSISAASSERLVKVVTWLR